MRPLLVAFVLLSLAPSAARGAQERYALFRLDPLGIAPQIVGQLERILRVELERAIGSELPSEQAVKEITAKNSRLANCTADPGCLQPLARALSVNRVVAGTVAGLADSYVVNLKLVDEHGRELRRVGATLRGSPEELIEEVRVAALRLVAPEQLVGGIVVLSDVPDATVLLDGIEVGKTPLAKPLANLPVGLHQLAVERAGFSSFSEEVPVRLQKTTQVMVRQHAVSAAAKHKQRRAGEVPLYTRWYFWTGVAVVAVAGGLAIGFALPKPHAVDCAQGGCP